MPKESDVIKEILADLYAADPELRQYEAELTKAVSILLSARPKLAMPSQKFIDGLKQELIQRAEIIKANSRKPQRQFWSVTIENMKKTLLVSGGALVAVMVLVAVLTLTKSPAQLVDQTSNENSIQSIIEKDVAKQKVAKVQANAFGRLSGQTAPGGSRSAAESFSPTPSAALGMGGGGVATSDKSAPASDRIMPPIEQTRYVYVYKGSELKAPDQQMEVLKRVRGFNGPDVANLLKRSGMGMANLESFDKVKMQNISFVEDKDKGLSFYVNFEDGSLSIGQNWLMWAKYGTAICREQGCYQSMRIKLEDIPADQDLISVSDRFLADHGINMAYFGKGEVDNRWRIEYERFQDKSQFYIPEALTVIYPLTVDDKPIYNESGDVEGLRVTVDVRQKQVTNVWGITNQQYQSSDYEMEQDTKRILQVAEWGGLYGNYYPPEATKTVEIELGEPKLVYARQWLYNQDSTLSEEIFVPAYIFPILKQPQDNSYYYRQNVIVPLAKQILDNVPSVVPGPILMDKAQ